MALSGDEGRVVHQIGRLRNALKRSDADQAVRLDELLAGRQQQEEAVPSALEEMPARRSSLRLTGESLYRSTPAPIDRKTGVPLARFVFPEERGHAVPILDPELEEAVSDQLKEWDRVAELARIGVRPNMRCLIYGAPGVGKTLLARFIGRQLRMPVVEARLDGLISPFPGTTARNIGALFDFANHFRCVLFLDEFDAMARARDDSQEVGENRRLANTLVQCLDARGVQGFTLAATNHDHLLDPAVWRRFESRVHIPKPGAETRLALLRRALTPIKLSDGGMRMLVWLTEGMSGADIETLIAGAKRYLALHGGAGRRAGGIERPGREAWLAALRRQAILNGRLFKGSRHGFLLRPDRSLLDALIEDAELSQAEAASILGISQSTVSRRLRADVKGQADRAAVSEV